MKLKIDATENDAKKRVLLISGVEKQKRGVPPTDAYAIERGRRFAMSASAGAEDDVVPENRDFAAVQCPYAMKLLLHEIASLGIGPRLDVTQEGEGGDADRDEQEQNKDRVEEDEDDAETTAVADADMTDDDAYDAYDVYDDEGGDAYDTYDDGVGADA